VIRSTIAKAIAGVRWQRYVPAGCRIRAAGDRNASYRIVYRQMERFLLGISVWRIARISL